MNPARITPKVLKLPSQMDLSDYCIPDNHSNPAAFEKFLKTKSTAAERFREFFLGFEEFVDISSSNCWYCGIEPHQLWLKFPDGRFDLWWRLPSRPRYAEGKIYGFICNGIDRRDNDDGYHLDNSVACCYYCNTMKGSYTEEFFTERIKSIYENMRLNSIN